MQEPRFVVSVTTASGRWCVWDTVEDRNAGRTMFDVEMGFHRQGTAQLVADELNARAVAS
jgi:hypothetical protein